MGSFTTELEEPGVSELEEPGVSARNVTSEACPPHPPQVSTATPQDPRAWGSRPRHTLARTCRLWGRARPVLSSFSPVPAPGPELNAAASPGRGRQARQAEVRTACSLLGRLTS